MTRIPREIVLIVATIIIVAVITGQVSPEREQSGPNLVSSSGAPTGARALYLWLEQLGYRVERMQGPAFALDDSAKVLFILSPSAEPTEDELVTLRGWVERGGTLVTAGDVPNFWPAGIATGQVENSLPAFLRRFDLSMRVWAQTKVDAQPGQPLLLHPAVSTVHMQAMTYVTGTASLVGYLGESDRPVAAGLEVGNGRVYVLASMSAWSNLGLGQADNGALVLNWLPAPQQGGRVVFDELHHGQRQPPSIEGLLVHQPWGWALLYALVAAFVYLLLSGRHFGRTVPVITDTRRAAAEYVVSLAGLLRRGGKGEWAAQHYENALRQSLLAACALDLALQTPDVIERVSTLGVIAGSVDGKEAARVLRGLHNGAQHGIAEGRLVSLAAEASAMIRACSGRRS